MRASTDPPRWAAWLSLLAPLAAGVAARFALDSPTQLASGLSPHLVAAMGDELLIARHGQLAAVDGYGHERVVVAHMPGDALAVAADGAGRVYWSEPSSLTTFDTATGETSVVVAPRLTSLVWSCDLLVGLQGDGLALVTWKRGESASTSPTGEAGPLVALFPGQACGRVGAFTATAVGEVGLADGQFTPLLDAVVQDAGTYAEGIVTIEGDAVVLRPKGDGAPQVRRLLGARRLAGRFTGGVGVLLGSGEAVTVPLW